MNHIRLHRALPKGVKTLVTAFGGWSDAGDSATGAIEYLIRSRRAQPLAELDAEEFFDVVPWPDLRLAIIKMLRQIERSCSHTENQ